MDNSNSGSFGAALGPGAGSAIQEAMNRRQGPQQQNTTSPEMVPPSSPPQGGGLPAQQPGAAPTPSPSPMGMAPLPPTGDSLGVPPATTDKQLILKAMDSALKSISKVEEAQSGLMK